MTDLEECWEEARNAIPERVPGKAKDPLAFGEWRGYPTVYEMIVGAGGSGGHRHRCQTCPNEWTCERECIIRGRWKDGVGASKIGRCSTCEARARAAAIGWQQTYRAMSGTATNGTYIVPLTSSVATSSTWTMTVAEGTVAVSGWPVVG